MSYPGLRHPATFRSSEAERIAYQAEQNKINLAIYKRKVNDYGIKRESDKRLTSANKWIE